MAEYRPGNALSNRAARSAYFAAKRMAASRLAVVVGGVVVRQPGGPSAPVVEVIRVGPVAERDAREASVRLVGVGGRTRRQPVVIRRRDSGDPPGVRVVVAVLPLEAVDVACVVGAEVMIRGPADAVIAHRVLGEPSPVRGDKLCVTRFCVCVTRFARFAEGETAGCSVWVGSVKPVSGGNSVSVMFFAAVHPFSGASAGTHAENPREL